MDINLTLFVQAMHFFIAYYVLEKFFCRPLVKDIQKEQKEHADLIATITAQQKLLTEKEQNKQQEWIDLKRSFVQLFPIHIQKHIPLLHIRKPISISKQEKLECQKKMEELLFTRLKHVT